MRIRDTLAELAARRMDDWSATASGRLVEVTPSGSNPGMLAARMHVPDNLSPGAPLVVALHGCTQSAEAYDDGAGWSRLADRAGFAVLLPEQRRANNANLCFNWFEGADIARYGGEAESIAQLVGQMIDRHSLDRQRVFVTGLSAGGAMAAVMLAAYPDLFAGGAIIGGLPYDCAQGVAAALQCMRRNPGGGRGAVDAVTLAPGFAPVRWPTVSIWHGSADHTVRIDNLDAMSAQWRGVHGADGAPSDVAQGSNWRRERWTSGDRVVVETWQIAGMGHGVPVDPVVGVGKAGAYMLPVGIDSTTAIARSWNLIAETGERIAPATRITEATEPKADAVVTALSSRPAAPSSVQAIIENALRSAGLVK